MSRTTILLLFFTILTIVYFWYSNQESTTEQSTVGADREFAIENTDQIHKIFIADRKGQQTTLVRKAGYWEYNDQYKVNPNVMKNLLDAISRIEVKFQPADAAVSTMVASLASNGLKVELYDQTGELLKSYYIGGSTPDERGTYMIMAGASQPYVNYLPGWSGNLRFRFNLQGDQWRDKTVFAFQHEEVKTLKVIYPKQQSKSFEIQTDKNRFSVSPVYQSSRKEQEIKPGSIQRYLTGFDHLIAESFENNNPRKDSIRRNVPFCSITVNRLNGETRKVDFYPIFYQPGFDIKSGEIISSNEVERFFADIDGKDLMLVQNRVFKNVFWAYDFFFDEQLEQ